MWLVRRLVGRSACPFLVPMILTVLPHQFMLLEQLLLGHGGLHLVQVVPLPCLCATLALGTRRLASSVIVGASMELPLELLSVLERIDCSCVLFPIAQLRNVLLGALGLEAMIGGAAAVAQGGVAGLSWVWSPLLAALEGLALRHREPACQDAA